MGRAGIVFSFKKDNLLYIYISRLATFIEIAQWSQSAIDVRCNHFFYLE